MRGRLAIPWLVILGAFLTLGCEPLTEEVGEASLSPSSQEPAISAVEVALPPPRETESNPLDLPLPDGATPARGEYVYAVVADSLSRAAFGKTLVFRLSKVLDTVGDDLLVRQPYGVPYAIHPSLAVPLKQGRVRRRAHVLVPRSGRMAHGVVRTFQRKNIVVDYTDIGLQVTSRGIAPNQIGLLADALEPGGFATYMDGEVERHVTLVSRGVDDDGKVKWLALGPGSVAMRIEGDRLRALPVAKRWKVGDNVRVAWEGVMTPARVKRVQPSGLLVVKRERFGGIVIAGSGRVRSARE